MFSGDDEYCGFSRKVDDQLSSELLEIHLSAFPKTVLFMTGKIAHLQKAADHIKLLSHIFTAKISAALNSYLFMSKSFRIE
jgi:hypothetical protein